MQRQDLACMRPAHHESQRTTPPFLIVTGNIDGAGRGLTKGDSPGLQLTVHLASLHRNEHHPNTDHD